MKTNTSNTDSAQIPVPPTAKIDPPATPAPATPPVVEAAATHDDLGYEIVPDKEEKPKDEPAKKDEPAVEKKATGYGEPAEEEEEEETPPPKEEEKPKDDKDLTDEEKYQKEISETVKAFGEGYDTKKLEKFALDNKFSKAQLEAYIGLVKSESAEAIKANKLARKTQREEWRKDLTDDKEFGGVNFDKNVDQVEKLLDKYLHNTKKVLTEKGLVLPPYLMRDFLSLSKALNPVTSFVGGEAPTEPEDDSNFLEDMYK